MTPTVMIMLLAAGGLGAACGRLVRLPLWPLTGSLLGAAIAHQAIGGSMSAPAWWALTAQVLVGAAVGAAVTPGMFRQFRAVLLPGLLTVALIIGAGIICGLGIAATGRVDSEAAVLGMVPGGVGEMVAAAAALHTDSAVVAGMHVARLVLVLSTVPLLVRWARRMAQGRDDDA